MEQHHITVSRSARYYRHAGGAGADTWYVLHGYGQRAAAFLEECAPLHAAARQVVAPEGLSRFYLRGGRGEVGASWMTREDREHEIADHVAYLDAVHREVSAQHGAAGRIFVLGFSQGCATAGRWAALGKTPVDTLVLWGGALPPDVDAARTPCAQLLLVAGRGDASFPEAACREEERRLAAAGRRCESLVFDGGHELPAEALRLLARRLA